MLNQIIEEIPHLTKVAFLPTFAFGSAVKWLRQVKGEFNADLTLGGKIEKDFFLPAPSDLGALSELVSAIVLTDGIVITNLDDVDWCTKYLPSWAVVGETEAYRYLEDRLCEIKSEKELWHICSDDIKSFLKELSSPYSFTDQKREWEYYLRLVDNFLAWEDTIKAIRFDSNESPKKELVLSTEFLITRSSLNKFTTNINFKDIANKAYSDFCESMGEIQLPLILAAATAKMDNPSQLFDVLFEMRNEVLKLKERIADIENIVNERFSRGSGSKLRKIKKDYDVIINQSAMGTSAASNFNAVVSTLSTDLLTICKELLNGELMKKLLYRYTKPELLLLSRWTNDCAMHTIGKLKKIFKIRGSDKSWLKAAQALQIHGTVAWIPSIK